MKRVFQNIHFMEFLESFFLKIRILVFRIVSQRASLNRGSLVPIMQEGWVYFDLLLIRFLDYWISIF